MSQAHLGQSKWLLGPIAAAMLTATPLAGGANPAAANPCQIAPATGPTVNVKDKGAKGDGRTNDSAPLQRAIDAVAGKGGTVFVPDGVYMVDAVNESVKLKNRVTLKLSPGATLKVIPNALKHYALLLVSKASDVTILGGTLDGDRNEHTGVGGEWGMGVRIVDGSARVTISGTTSRNMWGDGFYIENASDVALCGVTADRNRRQGLSIIEGQNIDVVGSTFSNTHGTEPSAGIDLEPDRPEQKITRVSIQRSKFIDNAGEGILIAARKKANNVTDVSISNNYFAAQKPIKIKYAPGVLDSAICNNRYIVRRDQPNDITSVADRDEFMTVTAACGDQGIRIRQ